MVTSTDDDSPRPEGWAISKAHALQLIGSFSEQVSEGVKLWDKHHDPRMLRLAIATALMAHRMVEKWTDLNPSEAVLAPLGTLYSVVNEVRQTALQGVPLLQEYVQIDWQPYAEAAKRHYSRT